MNTEPLPLDNNVTERKNHFIVKVNKNSEASEQYNLK